MAPGCPGKNFCNGASQNFAWHMLGMLAVQTHSNRNWLPVAELRSSIAGCLGTTHAGPVGQNRIVTKVACLSHGAML